MDRVEIRVACFDDLIQKIQRFDSFRVLDKVYTADWLIPRMIIRLKDLVEEGSITAAMVLYWGLEATRARRHHARVQASYRAWRDRAWMEAKRTPDTETGKLPSNELAERIYRSSPEYGDWQQRIHDAQEGAEMAEAVLEAFRLKAEMIKTEERLMRDEAGGPYTVSEEPRESIPRTPQLEGEQNV
jgi:hypothetical protein